MHKRFDPSTDEFEGNNANPNASHVDKHIGQFRRPKRFETLDQFDRCTVGEHPGRRSHPAPCVMRKPQREGEIAEGYAM